jgi:hypothetical protein
MAVTFQSLGRIRGWQDRGMQEKGISDRHRPAATARGHPRTAISSQEETYHADD